MIQFDVKNMGSLSYRDGMHLMDVQHSNRVKGEGVDTLFILEHFPVISKGRRMGGQALPNEQLILAHGIEIQEADRGGLLTYHGPGQIVFYFVME